MVSGAPQLTLFQGRMNQIREVIDEIRSDSLSEQSRRKILSGTANPSGNLWISKLAVAGAACLILAVPLGALLVNDLVKHSSFNGSNTNGVQSSSKYYALDTFARDQKSQKLSKLVKFFVEPYDRGDFNRDNAKSEASLRAKKWDKFYPISSPNSPPQIEQARNELGGFPLLFSMSLEESVLKSKLLSKQTNPLLVSLGPAIVDFEGKALRLQKWQIKGDNPEQWCLSYAANSESVTRRLEFYSRIEGTPTLMYRFDTHPISEAEFRKHVPKDKNL